MNEDTDRLDAALGRWSSDPRLAALAGEILLVLDGEASRILHASEGAASLRSALADREGRVRPALGLAAQIGRLGPLTDAPRIARLRLDARGIALPVACRVARADLENGSTALLVAPLTAASLRRSGAGRAQPERNDFAIPDPAPPDHPPAVPASAGAEPSLPSRFVWRSDGAGRLTHVSGHGAIVDALLGRSWETVCAEARSGGEALLTALRDRRTFRALALVLRVPGLAGETGLDVSGAPSGRANGAVADFAGFAVVRERNPAPEPDAASEIPSESKAASATEAVPEDASVGRGDSVRHAGSFSRAAEGPVGDNDDAGEARRTDRDSVEGVSQDDPTASAAAVPTGAGGATTKAGHESALSIDERAAFREIARALGARFARDDGQAPRVPDTDPAPRGAVMPFPAASAPVEADPTEAIEPVLDRLPSGILVHRDDAILFANRRLLELAGFADLNAVRAAGGVSSRFPDLKLDGPSGEPMPLARADGESVPVLIERASLDWHGRPAAVLTARPAQKEQLRPPAEPAAPDKQAILDRWEEGVVTLDAAGHVLRLNAKAAAILGDAASGMIGKPFASLFDAKGTAAIDASLRQAQAMGASDAQDLAARPGEGSTVPLRVRIGRLLSTDDSPLYATLQDMAEGMDDTKRSEQEAASRRGAEEAARRKLAYFAKAGQEVRAPLNGILGVADAMLAEQFGPLGSERYRDYLHDIHASGGHALGLLNDLVELAEVEAGRIELAFADLPLNELVSRCIAELQPQAAQRRIVLRTSLADGLQVLHADERSLRQAAIKVLSHAIRLTEAGGQVIVSTTMAEHGDIALRVRDTGAGMSPDEVDQALDPFRQPRVPGARSEGGTGFGLTLTKALVEANRGRLRVTSRKDEGTLVEILFPGKAANA